MGLGGYLLDQLKILCLSDNPELGNLCIDLHPSEEILELIGTLMVIVSLTAYGLHSITRLEWRRHLTLSAFGFYALLFPISIQLHHLEPLFSLDLAERVAVSFADDTLELRGYYFYFPFTAPRLNSEYWRVGIFVKASRPLTHEFGYSFHIIDQASGEVTAGINEWSNRRHKNFVTGRTYRFQQHFNNLKDTPRNRALWLVLSLWYQDDDGAFHNYTISGSDLRLLSESHTILTEFVLDTETETTSAPALATFTNGFDLRQADFPAHARAGAPLSVDFTWSAANDGGEDWTQFLHFVHEESGYFWNHDQPPLGARLPTRLWYADLADRETWQFILPDDMPAGRYQLYTGLYRLSDLERMTVYDEFGDPLPDERLSLGFMQILPTLEESND